MTNSRKKPFLKCKLRWFQKYHNRRERRLAKEALNRGDYLLPETRITPARNWDVIDYVANPYKSPMYGLEEYQKEWIEKAKRK